MLYELIIPYKITGTLTYDAGQFNDRELKAGTRVLVPFRKNKVVTAIVSGIGQKNPIGFSPRKILAIADTKPMIDERTLKLWEWIATYYMCTIGEVMAAAVPLVLRPQGDMMLKRPFLDEVAVVKDELIEEIFWQNGSISVQEILQFLNKRNEPPNRLYDWLKEEILIWDDSYIKWGDYSTRNVLELNENFEEDEEKLGLLLNELDKKSVRQAEVLMLFLNRFYSGLPVFRDELKNEVGYNESGLNSLIKKGVLISEKRKRLINELGEFDFQAIHLTQEQESIYQSLTRSIANKRTTLLHGITGSGKTEIYLKACQDVIQRGQQVLFLMPEIALTIQMISRIQKALGPCVVVVHSNTNDKEKTEQWEQISSGKAKLVLGARSAIFSPFCNLGLIIVDEEHEAAYKQKDPAPRYHGRDAAIMLASFHNASVVLGSATPSIESYVNAESGKYDLLKLDVRFSNMPLPEIMVVDMRESMRKREVISGFSLELVNAIKVNL